MAPHLSLSLSDLSISLMFLGHNTNWLSICTYIYTLKVNTINRSLRHLNHKIGVWVHERCGGEDVKLNNSSTQIKAWDLPCLQGFYPAAQIIILKGLFNGSGLNEKRIPILKKVSVSWRSQLDTILKETNYMYIFSLSPAIPSLSFDARSAQDKQSLQQYCGGRNIRFSFWGRCKTRQLLIEQLTRNS